MARKYYDLNVPLDDDWKNAAKIIERLAKLGYNVVALNKLYLPSNKRERGGKKKVDASNGESTPNYRAIAEQLLKNTTEKPNDFKILTRVTVIIDNPDQVRCLQHDYIRSFDIIAIRPTNDKLFLQTCTQIEQVDIISLDLDNRIPFKIKHSMALAAIRRGLFIELSYASAIRSSSLRRTVLANAVSLVKYCCGKGLVFTSAGEHFMEMRAPKDIINLASMFGLKSDQANDTISRNCKSVVLHAYARSKTAKSVITMRKIGEPSNDLEKIVREGDDEKEDVSFAKCTPEVKRARAS